MLGFRRNLKLNKLLTNVIKLFIICFFGIVLFDKSSLNTVKDIVIKIDAEYICSFFSKIIIAFKTLAFDIPMIISFIIYIINFICVINCLIIFALLIYNAGVFIAKFLFGDAFFVHKNCDDRLVSHIYLINETFRC